MKSATSKSILILASLAAMLMSTSALSQTEKSADALRLYVGTYTRGDSDGIYILELDLSDGGLKKVGSQGGIVNPSFVAVHPSGEFLYAVSEVSDYRDTGGGAVSGFAIDPRSGSLKPLNHQSSGGAGPCYLVVDRSGKNVLVANYGGGSVAVLPIDEQGRLGEATAFIQHEGSGVDPQRQKGPHAHSINLDAENHFAFAADLGLDKIFVYRFDPKEGSLTPHDPASASVEGGSGPRHFAFHPGGGFAYVINEMALTVTAFSYDGDRGRLSPIQTIPTVPADADRSGLSTAEVQVHPSGKFLYGSNRGHDTIVVYSIDEKTGRLTHVENEPTGGKTPRNFAIDPTGRYLLAENQGSGSIVVFAIDPQSGELSSTGQSIEIPSPVCIKFWKQP